MTPTRHRSFTGALCVVLLASLLASVAASDNDFLRPCGARIVASPAELMCVDSSGAKRTQQKPKVEEEGSVVKNAARRSGSKLPLPTAAPEPVEADDADADALPSRMLHRSGAAEQQPQAPVSTGDLTGEG